METQIAPKAYENLLLKAKDVPDESVYRCGLCRDEWGSPDTRGGQVPVFGRPDIESANAAVSTGKSWEAIVISSHGCHVPCKCSKGDRIAARRFAAEKKRFGQDAKPERQFGGGHVYRDPRKTTAELKMELYAWSVARVEKADEPYRQFEEWNAEEQ